MAINRGVAPLDPTTDVGRFRLASGDVDFEPLDPPEVGFGNYAIWGDDQIEALIAIAGGSIPRAIALGYTQLAAAWTSSGATIKTDDLTYSAKDSVGSWMNLAKYWNDVADADEDRAINAYFDLVDIVPAPYCKPEAAPWPVCSCRGRCTEGCLW